MPTSTEQALREWRYGPVQSERLCAAILHTEGFDSVDPQCPMGGPDGLKDVLCEKAGRRFVAACYFPTTPKTIAEVKTKLKHDMGGIVTNNADAMAFFVNQAITPAERASLAEMVEPAGLNLYHLERMRAILDSPKGYGLRLEYLRIPMTPEEQLGLLSVINFKVDERLKEQSRQLAEITHVLTHVRQRTDDIAGQLLVKPSSLDDDADPSLSLPMSRLSIGDLAWVHRIATEGEHLPVVNRGRLREVQVWIGKGGGGPTEAIFTPPTPDQVTPRLLELLSSWRRDYPSLIGVPREQIVASLAAFHHGLLSIHPFIDANGRVARLVLQQQVVELLSQWISAVFRDEPDAYYASLRSADGGDLQPLSRLIAANLE